jgi:hypothetical protein
MEDQINNTHAMHKWRIELPVFGIIRIVGIADMDADVREECLVQVGFGCPAGQVFVRPYFLHRAISRCVLPLLAW